MKPIDKLNFDILHISSTKKQTLGAVTVPDVFTPSTNNFHPEGLYSVGYFGEQGSPERLVRFGRIDLKLPIIHPVIYHIMVSAKSLYGDIMSGTKYAKFNKKTKIFEESVYGEGETGYAFFMKYIKVVTLDDTGSASRNIAIKSLKQHKELTTTVLPVLPAGLRDYRIDADGRPSEDEINTMYRKMLGNAGFIPENTLSLDVLDPIRFKMQTTMQEIYQYVNTILYGKRGFVNKRLIDRRVHGATRNVLTGLQQESSNIADIRFIDDDTSVLGLYQTLKGSTHQASHAIRNFMSAIFPGEEVPFQMIDMKTLKRAEVPYATKVYRSLTTYDGINKLINSLTADTHEVILQYKKYYYALLYETDTEYMVLHDIEELPEGLDPADVRPMTLMDLLYLACNPYMDKLVGTITRYPVLNHGSIFATRFAIKTTIHTYTKYEVGPNGRTGVVALRYPRPDTGLYRSISVNTSKLDPLSADFDGDTCSVIIASSDEAIAEINGVLDSAQHWLNVEGDLLYTGQNDFNKMTMKVLTAAPI